MQDAREKRGDVRRRARYVGLDVGEVRLGVAALEDGVATPLSTLTRAGTRRDIAAVQALVGLPPAGAVVGLPPEADDPRTCAARRAREFARRLHEATGWEVVLVDEADSTAIARARLQALGLRASGLRGHLDSWAAVEILQRFAAGAPAEAAPRTAEAPLVQGRRSRGRR